MRKMLSGEARGRRGLRRKERLRNQRWIEMQSFEVGGPAVPLILALCLCVAG